MVSVLCRSFFHSVSRNSDYYLVDEKKRTLVAAPTNKAIAVLASRFLDMIKSPEDIPLNIVLIGVEDKLVSDEEDAFKLGGSIALKDDALSVTSVPSSLRGIFVYTWVQSMIDAYHSLANDLHFGSNFEAKMKSKLRKSELMIKRIQRSIPHQAHTCGYIIAAERFHAALGSLSLLLSVDTSLGSIHRAEAFSALEQVCLCLESINSISAVQELLATANIIFCTLSTSGVAAMKQTRRVHGKWTIFILSNFYASYSCL